MKDVFPDLLLSANIVLTIPMHLLAQSGSSFDLDYETRQNLPAIRSRLYDLCQLASELAN
jgi:hypothetical protein